jgi:hypothetical protein
MPNVKDVDFVDGDPIVNDVGISAEPMGVHAEAFDQPASWRTVSEARDARCDERLDVARRLRTPLLQ